MFWRSREAAIFIFIFPLLLYSLLSSVYSQDITVNGAKVASAGVLLAGVFGYGAANTAVARVCTTFLVSGGSGALK